MSKQKLRDCSACGNKTSVRAAACPSCGEPMSKPKKKRSPLKGLFILFILIFGVGVLAEMGKQKQETWAREHPEEAAKLAKEKAEAEARKAEEKAKAELENRRKGFHCLSSWDGSHRAVKNYVEDEMRDPDSFEHIETRITAVNEKGKHTLIMKYRARNGFGGMTVGVATATVENAGCGATVVSLN